MAGELDRLTAQEKARLRIAQERAERELTGIRDQYTRLRRLLSTQIIQAAGSFQGGPFTAFIQGSTRNLANYQLQLLQGQARFEQGVRRAVYSGTSEMAQQVRFANTAFLNSVVGQIIPGVSAQVGLALAEFAANTNRRANRRVGLARAHAEVAVGAQRATIRSYQRRVNARKHISYRSGEGRLPGRMLKALQNADFVEYSADGIQFGNQVTLDRIAAHWYRLNYGTAPAPQRPVPDFQLRTKEGPLGGSLSDTHGPSGAFALPPGIFFDLRTGKVVPRRHLTGTTPKGSPVEGFIPFVGIVAERSGQTHALQRRARQSRQRARSEITSGITGYRFFDAGIDYIARNLPQKYIDIATVWFNESAIEAGDTVRVIRPT